MDGYLEVPHPMRDLNNPEPVKLRYDFRTIFVAEERTKEMAFVTATKAPELLSVLSKACFDLGRHISDLQFQHHLSEKRMAERRAVLIVDVIPAKLKEKGITSSETTRQAFIDLDRDHGLLSDAEAEVHAALAYAKMKLTAMEKAMSAVKALVGESGSVYYRPNPNLSTAGGQERPAPTETTEPTAPGRLVFGKPNYKR